MSTMQTWHSNQQCGYNVADEREFPNKHTTPLYKLNNINTYLSNATHCCILTPHNAACVGRAPGLCCPCQFVLLLLLNY